MSGSTGVAPFTSGSRDPGLFFNHSSVGGLCSMLGATLFVGCYSRHWGLGLVFRGLGLIVRGLGLIFRGLGLIVRGLGLIVRGLYGQVVAELAPLAASRARAQAGPKPGPGPSRAQAKARPGPKPGPGPSWARAQDWSYLGSSSSSLDSCRCGHHTHDAGCTAIASKDTTPRYPPLEQTNAYVIITIEMNRDTTPSLKALQEKPNPSAQVDAQQSSTTSCHPTQFTEVRNPV